jgi:hypothetical protein
MFRSILSLTAMFSSDKMLTGTAVVADCAPGSVFKINSIYLDPTTAVAGQVTDLHIDYTVPEAVYIYDGASIITYTFNGLPFSPTTGPLCAQIPCPLMPGTYVNTSQSSWPAGVTGKIITRMSWYDINNTELLCFQISAKI